MHDFSYDFDSVTPDLWMSDEDNWKNKLSKLTNWYQVLIDSYYL